jgi:hypothetical protein
MLVRMLWAAFSVSLAIRPLRASTSSRSTSTRITSAFSTARTMTTRTAFTHTSRTGTSNMRTRTAASSSVFCWTAAASLAMMSSAHSPPHSTSLAHSHSYSHSYSYCQEAESKEQEEEEDSNYNSNANAIISTPPFPETALTFDHYNGATLDLGLLPFVEDNIATDTDTDTTAGAGAGAGAGDTINDTERKATLLKTCFPKDLANALTFWRAEGRKGIWIRVPVEKADLVPVRLGFQAIECVVVLWSNTVRVQHVYSTEFLLLLSTLTTVLSCNPIFSEIPTTILALRRSRLSIPLGQGSRIAIESVVAHRECLTAAFGTNASNWSGSRITQPR